MDASDFAIGVVLSQNQGKGEQPVAYESRKLSPAEQKYAVHEKELLAIVHAIKLWHIYLEGQKFTVITDHASFKYSNLKIIFHEGKLAGLKFYNPPPLISNISLEKQMW
ncbi:7436_t:CDS:1 [Paraglomus occultum]|uniref:7436_t:CDS:1 n=1 Tax=Paraglomus occultum TaxID=144539 RepID=A0A9N9GNP1_9GLOM|nr:7436_t:CDS:1 [Paraglomus occultum]